MRLSLPLTCLALSLPVFSQEFVPPPQGLSEVISERFPGARITYKEVNGICETSDGVKSYSGYVHLPKSFIPDAVSWPDDLFGHFFFWYFEARNAPKSAPTAIYLGGGPGYTTFDGSAVFPCYFNSDSNSTSLNDHSWNQDTNMLYIDQPLGVGFSYTSLTNGTYDLVSGEFSELGDGDDLPELSLTLRQATLNRHSNATLTNTTMTSARTLWRFAQVFFNDFPEWETENDNIAVWAVSYGGLYGPIFASYTVDQNALIVNESHNVPNSTTLNISTVGVINGVVDVAAMARGFPEFLNSQTGGSDLVTEEETAKALQDVQHCHLAIKECQAAAAEGDPDHLGVDAAVNEICVAATVGCIGFVEEWAMKAPVSNFDISITNRTKKPSEYNTAFFNQAWVQSELGVPLNFTRLYYQNIMQKAFLVGDEAANFAGTGDAARYNTSFLSNLMDNGVNVAMVYGDLDFQCNWISGENASLQINFANKSSFASAGYAPLMTNSSHEGGLVRESGLLSFSRVYQAGHSAGGYQPETVSAIFKRALFGYDVATGEIELSNNRSYSTEGKRNISGVDTELHEPDDNVCYVLSPVESCTNEQLMALENGTAETQNWVVISPKGSKEIDGGSDDGNGEETDDGNNGSGNTVGDEDSSSKLTGTMGLAFVMSVLAVFFG